MTYSDNGNGSGSSGFEYRYEDLNNPNNITAKSDLAGNLIATWSYDDQDRAVESVNREGQGATINYDDPENVVVTDAYGISKTYGISQIASRKKIVSNTGASNCSTCSSDIIRTEFDSTSGYPTEREFSNGRIDQYQNYDDRGNPGTTITAVGTDDENIVTTTWHPVLSTPTTRTQKSLLADGSNPDRAQISIWDYDDPSADGDTDIPNENPTSLIYRHIFQGFTHNDTGAVTAIEQITTYEYNSKGQVISINGPLAGDQDIVTFSYDPVRGDLLSVTRPLTGTTTFTHDAIGSIITATNENQVQTVFVYDGRNRQVSETSDGASSANTYTAAGTLASVTDRTGRTQTMTYDTKGFLQRIIDPSGNYLSYIFDENGNQVESSIYSADGIKTLFKGYDYGDPAADITLAPGKPAKTLAMNHDGSAVLETLFSYENGNLVQVTDPSATVRQFSYDSLNRLVKTEEQQTDTITAETVYAYDRNNNLIQVTDPEGLNTVYTYDDTGRLIKIVSRDTGTTNYAYDVAGNLVRQQTNDGSVTLYTYDELGRRTGIQYPDADQDVLFFYDQGINGKGCLTGISHAGDAYAFSYDAMGNLVTKLRTTEDTTFTTSYGYDAQGRTVSMTYPDGRIVSYERDATGNVLRVTTAKEDKTQVVAENIDHKPFGPMSSMTLGQGQEVSKIFDLNYRPVGLTAPGVLERSLVYDPAGRITTLNDHLENSRTEDFGYDKAGRLLSATGAYGSLGFTYDKTGNRLTRTLDGETLSYGITGGTNHLNVIMKADDPSEVPIDDGDIIIIGPDDDEPEFIAEFNYDDNGRVKSKNDMSMSYNHAGRLSSISNSEKVLAEYVYNSMGQRTRKISDSKTTLYHYDISGNLIGESTPAGDFFMDYIYLENTRLAVISSDPDNTFEVRVTTSTGRAIEGIKIYAFNPSGSYAGIYATTDSNGIAAFQKFQLTASTYTFRADYLNEQFWTSQVAPDTDGIDLTIQETAQTVTIIQNSNPVAGINVYVFDENDVYLGLYAVTDADGQVSFNLPLSQSYRFRADILGSQYFSDTITTTGEEIVIDSNGGILSFALTGDGGAPITDVTTYVFSESGSYLGKSSATDSQGLAYFDLPEGSYKLRCDYLGYQFWSETITLVASGSSSLSIPHQEITLSALKTLGTASEPTAGIQTYLFTEAGIYLSISKTTDSEGSAVYTLPEKSYKIRGDYLSTQYWSESFTWTDPSITIAQGVVTLNLTNAGQSLPDVNTYAFSSGGTYLGLNATTDDQGQVSFTLPQGTYTFRADWLGSQYWSDALTVTAGETTLADLSTGGGTVTLTAAKDDQTPLQSIQAYLFNETGTYLDQNTLTDDSGQAAFILGNGTYKIRLDYFGYQFWTDTFTIPDDTAIDLTIPHNLLTATVTTANAEETAPLSGITVYLFTESGTYMSLNAISDTNGQAAFELPEQPYKLRADYLGGQYWSEVFTNEDQSIEIPLGNVLVSVGEEDAPLSGVTVYVFSDTGTYMGLNSVTNEEGIAEFSLPQGTWKFRADYLGSQYWAEGSILPDQDIPIEINPGGGSLTLTLEKESGSPISNVKVYAFSSAGKYLGLNQASLATGQVSFDLPEGEYKFRADYLGYQFWTDALSVPETSSQTLSIPHQDVTIMVQGQFQESFPIQGAKTYLFTVSGSYQGVNTTTNTNGQAVYSLPGKPYKIRADYLGNQYWSEEITHTDKTITVDHGNALISVTQSDTPVSDARVYLFSESGSYLGQSANTDSTGSSEFILPVNTYKFRVDHGGSQYWSNPVDLIAVQDISIDLNLDALALDLTSNPHYARFDGDKPQKEDPTVFLASIGSLAGYTDNGVSQPTTVYYINDHLGTPIKVIDDEGQVLWDGAYMPFGQVSDSVGEAQNQFRFPGQYFDGETGLHYNYHRYYDPETGRYLTPDPIGLAGGINLYAYVGGNPINYIDPYGLRWFGGGLAVVWRW